MNAELKARLPAGTRVISKDTISRENVSLFLRDATQGGIVTERGNIVVVNVDDQDAPRYVKTRDLQEHGFTVIEARTGAEALRVIEAERPPIVLLDVELPEITGYDVCSFIKKKWPDVMVLMTSSTFRTSVHRTRDLDSGADTYLVQPAEPLELAAAVNALPRIRSAEDSMRALNASLEQRIKDRVADLEAANLKLRGEIEARERAEAALVQSQKMEAIGQLTGGLAHDFNNLLTAVVGNLDMIRMRATDPRIVRQAEHAFKAAERGSKLTAQLLAFSRTQKLATAPVDLSALISGMGALVNQTLGAEITVETDLFEGLPHALADTNQLELAILNLSINARDAMPGGGTLTISTKSDATNPQRVVVCVADTGTGMPPEVVARAFDPFFTTKRRARGRGWDYLRYTVSFGKSAGTLPSIQPWARGRASASLYLSLSRKPKARMPVRAMCREAPSRF
ncbi:response regulator [Bradyrhizobium elkanii]|uniref:response regulator n=1 Tax=Bradyrhizobium elkanii TaxID=29448 RepID=UPI002715143E|nr:response regulator [Bradyrhizobium elkanii]WLA89063.1 response regulator [Bradyrhizobium elkanii]